MLVAGFLCHHQLNALIDALFKWYGLEVVSIKNRHINATHAILCHNLIIMVAACGLKILLFCGAWPNCVITAWSSLYGTYGGEHMVLSGSLGIAQQ
ncbi:MAG: hypothetical protein ACPGC9_01275 [Cytophagales bacterium]